MSALLLTAMVYFLGPEDPRTDDPRWAAVGETCGGYIDEGEAVFPLCEERCEDLTVVELGEGYEPEPVASVTLPIVTCRKDGQHLVVTWE